MLAMLWDLYLSLRVNNAIRDAPENYISCIKEYENEMIKWTSDVLRSRYICIRMSSS
jgi:hypothetical protein